MNWLRQLHRRTPKIDGIIQERAPQLVEDGLDANKKIKVSFESRIRSPGEPKKL
jgi:hypothetical protein